MKYEICIKKRNAVMLNTFFHYADGFLYENLCLFSSKAF